MWEGVQGGGDEVLVGELCSTPGLGGGDEVLVGELCSTPG